MVGAACGVVVQRQGIEAAFCAGDGGQGLDGDVRCAGRRELREGRQRKGGSVSSRREKAEGRPQDESETNLAGPCLLQLRQTLGDPSACPGPLCCPVRRRAAAF